MIFYPENFDFYVKLDIVPYSYSRYNTDEVKKLCNKFVQNECRLKSAVKVKLIFNLPEKLNTREKSQGVKKYYCKRPDLDNLSRGIINCLQGVLWGDDKSIVSIFAEKLHSEKPSVELWAKYIGK